VVYKVIKIISGIMTINYVDIKVAICHYISVGAEAAPDKQTKTLKQHWIDWCSTLMTGGFPSCKI
jgi:hypothetical protein